MSHEQDKLRESLDRLQTQLDEIRKLDPALAADLERTLGETKGLLVGSPIAAARHQSIIERLSEAVLKYEASHPSLAGNLGSIIDALGRMGI